MDNVRIDIATRNPDTVSSIVFASGGSYMLSDGYSIRYCKRFILPDIAAPYDGVLLIDDDVHWNFSLSSFLQFVQHKGLHIVQPARSLSSPQGSVSYRLTLQRPDLQVHFTDFVECGPFTWLSSAGWQCIWHVLDGSCSSGWGLDMVWCRYASEACGLGEGACAVADMFTILHLDTRIAGGRKDYDPSAEWYFYQEQYGRWHSKLRTVGTLAL